MSKSTQTSQSFADKWVNNRDLAFAETLNEQSDIFNWIVTRNGLRTPDGLRQWLAGRSRLLDAGCGNGRVTALLRKYAPERVKIVGADLVAADVARANLDGLPNLEVHAADLLGDLAPLGEFDLIYCQEVLHHTADPRGAFLNLCGRLAPAGEIAIYVYKQKAPVREFVDDYVRDRVSGLSYEDSQKAMVQITELGRALSELNVQVRVPEVAVLGIEAGDYPVQRFLYHFFLKCFWNPELSFDNNVAVNYDWYHPQLCTRHTLPEVQEWFAAAQLRIVHECVDHYGITVRGIR